MYCSNCGKERINDAKFCYNCGNQLIEEQKIVKSGNQETSLVLGIICLVSSFFINILCFIPGIISIIYAKKYKKESGKLGVGFGLSLGGMIFSIIIFILILLFFVLIVGGINSSISNIDVSNLPEFTHNLPKV